MIRPLIMRVREKLDALNNRVRFDGFERRYRLYLPLRSRVLSCEISASRNGDATAVHAAKDDTASPEAPHERPICYYGTSIVHGAGVDRPLSIANVYQLQVIPVDELDPDVVLVRDIDASVTGEWNSNGGFTPISRFEDRTFDGQGFTISDLVIEARPEARAGLFERITNATVRNVVLSDVLIDSADGTAGALAARAEAAVIQNVSVSGDLSSSSDSSLGGLIGEAINDSMIMNASFSGSVTSTGSTGSDSGVGGLIGAINGGTVVEDSTSNATVTASIRDTVAGLVGWQRASSGVDDAYAAILHSTSSGSVEGDSQVGGLIGRSEDLTVVADSSSTSDVTASSRGGALVGVRVYSDIDNILGEGNSASGVLTVGGETVSADDESYLIGDLEDD